MPRTKEGFLWTPQQTTSGLPTDAVQPSSPTLRDHYDVIIIGAGFAGLIAARDLTRLHAPLRVLIVEARDRIGGRTWTAKVLGEELEMGGTWVHWDQPHLYSQLQRYGLHGRLKTSVGTLAPEKQFFKPAGGPVEEVMSPGDCAAALERVAARVFAVDGLDSRALMPFPHDSLREPAPWKRYDHLSVRDRLDAIDHGEGRGFSQREKDLFESNMGTIGSASAAEIGFVDALRWYALGGHSIAGMMEKAGVYKIGDGGMTGLARAILDDYRGDLLFNTAVGDVIQESSGVVVKTASGMQLRAKALISTIPLNCLGDVKFDPPLSALRASAIAQGHINKGAKIHFKLHNTTPGWFHTGDPKGDSNFAFAFSDHNGTQTTGRPTGTWCIGFGLNGHLTDKKNSGRIVDQFQKDVMPDAEVEAYITHDWMNDPYSKGVWACWGPDSAAKYLHELQKPHGRVIFASADWADGWRGFVDGAIERGQTAVRDVVCLLQKEESLAKL
ncbi:hypothetical protein FE257_006446 [Aspergillus nanangensis]|uniref:Amine oxidase n=1 Tax=Aspergillus nanangensis TaxID=2582783 RepID=A0AAD4CY12_ASPNN|nr:hypothetical protein FE257_006446 [Aspergillus nanangensis]